MDGRGRLAQPLKRTRQSREPAGADAAASCVHAPRPLAPRNPRFGALAGWRSHVHEALSSIFALRLPRGSGIAASVLFLVVTGLYGMVQGDHMRSFIAALSEAPDAVANGLGFRITTYALSGQNQLSQDDILAGAGVSASSSLLLLDVEAARAKLKANPWIADATVLKLYPGRLQITVTERRPFALWQKDGKVSVIAEDGTVLEPYVTRRLAFMPLVVGEGAELRAKEFLALLDRYPDIRDAVRASILVAERRWNLRLKNGVDVRLPEFNVEKALAALVALDHEKKLLSRDITAVDLRLADRVTVRLSEAAAKAREEALKERKTKRKGTDA
ncbi:MAG: cell division protein FtsQ/DivIB [Xanthobacteraceae bacterium]